MTGLKPIGVVLIVVVGVQIQLPQRPADQARSVDKAANVCSHCGYRFEEPFTGGS